MATKTGRARPLSAHQRRESIIDAAVPLFMDNGSGVTTRQIADAAGVAEGTLFRVFADKDAIVAAVVARVMDPTPTLRRITELPEHLSLEQTVSALFDILTDRIGGVIAFMTATGNRSPSPPPPRPSSEAAQSAAIAVLSRHREQLAVPAQAALALIRAAAFGTALAPFSGGATIDSREFARILINGIGKA